MASKGSWFGVASTVEQPETEEHEAQCGEWKCKITEEGEEHKEVTRVSWLGGEKSKVGVKENEVRCKM